MESFLPFAKLKGSKMKVICAWCGAHIKGDREDTDISHGKCDECVAKEKEEIQRRRKEKEDKKNKEEEKKK